MLQRLLIITLTLCSLTASAQWQQTGAKVRYVNGLGIPTKDTAAGVAADSSQILIRPADSSLYIKYKRTWVKVGAGGTIGGSGTINRVPKFTAGTTLGNSSIVDSASAVAMTINPSGNVGIGTASPGGVLDVKEAETDITSYAYGLDFKNSNAGGFSRATRYYNTNFLSSTAFFGVVGSNTSGVTRSYWVIGNPATDTTGYTNTNGVHLLSSGNVGIGYTAPAAKLAVNGTTLINTNTDNGVDKLQVSGSAIAEILKATGTNNNLAILNGTGTTNAYVDFQNAGTTQWRAGNDYNSGNRLFRINDVVGSRNTMLVNNLGQIGYNMPSTSFFNSSVGYQFHPTPGNSAIFYYLVNNATAGTQVYNSWDFKATKNNTFGSYGATLNGDYLFQLAVAGSGNSNYTGNSGNIVFIQNGAVGTHTPLDLTLGVTNSTGTYYTAVLKHSGSLDLNTSLNVNGVADNGVDKINVTGPIKGTGFRQAYVTKTGAYTATNDDYVIDCTSGTFTVTLPASSGRTGRILIIKNSGAGTITVDGNASETIDGAATYSLAVQYATIQIISDGTNWKIISKF
jgi:hypothetical protein